MFGVALSDSGCHLATCGASKFVNIFDIKSGAEVFRRSVGDRVRSIALSKTGRHCASGSFNGELHCCDVREGAHLHNFEQSDVVHCVALDGAGNYLAVGCSDGSVRCYGLSASNRDTAVHRRKSLGPLNSAGGALWVHKHDAKVWVVALSPSGEWLAAGDYADVVRVYRARKEGQLVWEKTTWATSNTTPYTWGLAFSADSGTLAIGHWDCWAYAIDTATWTERARARRGGAVYSVSLDATGRRLAVGGRDKTAAVYDIGAPPHHHEHVHHRRGIVAAGAGKADKSVALTTKGNGRKDQSKSKGDSFVVVTAVSEMSIGAFVYSLELTRDGRHLAVGTDDLGIALFSVAKRERVVHLPYHGVVASIALSPDGRYLAVGGEEHAVTVWRLGNYEHEANENPERVLVLPRAGNSVSSVCFSDARCERAKRFFREWLIF